MVRGQRTNKWKIVRVDEDVYLVILEHKEWLERVSREQAARAGQGAKARTYSMNAALRSLLEHRQLMGVTGRAAQIRALADWKGYEERRWGDDVE